MLCANVTPKFHFLITLKKCANSQLYAIIKNKLIIITSNENISNRTNIRKYYLHVHRTKMKNEKKSDDDEHHLAILIKHKVQRLCTQYSPDMGG